MVLCDRCNSWYFATVVLDTQLSSGFALCRLGELQAVSCAARSVGFASSCFWWGVEWCRKGKEVVGKKKKERQAKTKHGNAVRSCSQSPVLNPVPGQLQSAA